jgi:TQXA domain-containing protein
MSVLSLPTPLPTRTRADVAVRRRVRPRPAAELSPMTRYRGGTYSHTVDTIVFTDGSSARTDLIRLNPNVEAYSLDFTGIAPVQPSRYRVETWSAVPNLGARSHEAEVDWILRNSYPVLGTAALSRQLRAAGHALGSANITEHEAIAGTQAAIWFLTNGLALDDRPLNVPIAEHRDSGRVTVEFDGEPQLGGYCVDVASDAPVSVVLQRSADRTTWQDVSGSRLEIAAPGEHRKTLGVGSTLSASSHARPGRGYRYYRLNFTAAGRVAIGDIRFWLNGSRHYRNADRVVHLYNYLLAGARRARRRTVTPRLVSADAVLDAGLVGPFRLHTSDVTALSVPAGHTIVDADGVAHGDLIAPGVEFYLRPAPGCAAVTLTATVPGSARGFGGRVLTGVARDEVAGRFTPLALAVPTQLVVDFHISWDAQETGLSSAAPSSAEVGVMTRDGRRYG